ncbi:hypothetical protein [Scleromatobacter humisilvae]|uniref:DUF1376 domain-containing protein n=1 Tax=Scleromatobacter humisilvae TaxID=2897159 RepID=A0A9X1YIT3_9BURK|nr:hypothetical protein [Scleromatobacter humisilvae]MCK9687279.1 hypothetical protein [Scleromatobacter humisilvae]
MKSFKGLEKVSGLFASAVYARDSFPVMKAVHVGCLFAWARQALASGQTGMRRTDLRDHAAYFAGLDAAGFEQLVNELVAMRLVAVGADDTLELVDLADSMRGKSAESARRKAGWQKRRNGSADGIAAPSRVAPTSPASAAAPGLAPIEAALQTSLLDPAPIHPSGAGGRQAPARRPPAPNPLRIGTDDDYESPVIMRLEVKGGQVVEFTDAFRKAMEPLYPGVDVNREMLCASEWCHSRPERRKTLKGARAFVTGWLSRSAQRREVTMAVVASGNQRNGFGQGGRYSTEMPASPVAGGDSFDDFADLVVPGRNNCTLGLFADDEQSTGSVQ